MKAILATLAAVLLAACAVATPHEDPQPYLSVGEMAARTVVVECSEPVDPELPHWMPQDTSTGAGFIVSEDTILTAAHVVDSAENSDWTCKVFMPWEGPEMGEGIPATIKAFAYDDENYTADYAILSADTPGKPEPVAVDGTVALGEHLWAVGHPGLTYWLYNEGYVSMLPSGVDRLERQVSYSFMASGFETHGGLSGGAVFSSEGLIGVVIATRGFQTGGVTGVYAAALIPELADVTEKPVYSDSHSSADQSP